MGNLVKLLITEENGEFNRESTSIFGKLGMESQVIQKDGPCIHVLQEFSMRYFCIMIL